MIKIKYFPSVSIYDEKPTTVFRYFDKDEKSPERYKPGFGWVEDDRLLLLFMNGDLTNSEEISESDAKAIINMLEEGDV